MQKLFGTVNPLPNFAPDHNIAPSETVPVIRRHPESGERHLDLLRWGLLPHFTKDPGRAHRPINARAETLTTSGLFRGAFARRRCLIPASHFYEWKTTPTGKQPYAIGRIDGDPLALGGIWEGWRGPDNETVRSFAIITIPPNADVADLHDRMPLILDPADWPAWLGETDADPTALLKPPPEGMLRLWTVPPQDLAILRGLKAAAAPKHNGAG